MRSWCGDGDGGGEFGFVEGEDNSSPVVAFPSYEGRTGGSGDGSEFDPDFTIISAGFDAARGDPLGCCDVTPTGYAQMTQMCCDLFGGKLLVILEGGYNLRSISSSATAVIKILLGESPKHNVEQLMPTKAGLRTVLEVLKIQLNYWPSLEHRFSKLLSEWGWNALQDKKKLRKKKRWAKAPTWWKWGRKRWLYKLWSKKLS